VFVATLIAYWPVLRGGFIWDDNAHVTKPVLRSLHGLWRIWFEVGATQQYYPVLHSAFWLEHRLWGDATLGYHLTNVFLHATAACLFGLILRRFWKRDDAAWLAAFLFALHPVGVESVAWISEQKNTLSVVFYLASAMTYLRWRETLVVKQVGLGGRARPLAPSALGVSPNERSGATAQPYLYFVALGLFVLALLSKSVTATLPAALLVVLWWQHGRLSWKRDILPLLPWFAIGAIAGVFTAWVERKYIGAEGAAFTLSFLQRCLLAGRVAWFYLAKLVWPANLIFVYPHWTVDPAAGWQYLFPLGAVVLLAALWLLRRRTRGPLAGALFFLGTLFPALGFFNVYPFLFSYVADHFQYLASLGIIALAAAGWARWTQGAMAEDAAGRPRGRPGSLLVAIPVLCLLGGLTWRQSRLYRDPQILYLNTLARNPRAWLLHGELGNIFLQSGQVGEAQARYEEALRINPDYVQGHNNLGDIFLHQNQVPAAIDQFHAALRLRPDYADTHVNLGSALAQMGRLTDAIPEYEEALRLEPALPTAHNDLGNALSDAGRLPEAISHYEQALRLQPDYAQAQNGLGVALFRSGDIAGAMARYENALRLKPAYADARYNLGNALARLGRSDEAIAQYQQALHSRPDWAELHYSLGVALAKAGRLPEAIGQYEEALRLRPDLAEAHANLGGALANVGRLPEAIAQLEEALRLEPYDAAVQYNLNLALRLVGRPEKTPPQSNDRR
jgi:tetratricopeptide (TPR) repeat protein